VFFGFYFLFSVVNILAHFLSSQITERAATCSDD
jgi:hypothetical protein